MSKTPKNLKKALAENARNTTVFNLDPILEEYESEFRSLASELAREHLNYGHSSDIVDADDDTVKNFLGMTKPYVGEDATDDHDDSGAYDNGSSDFDRWSHYEDIKDKFREKLEPVLKRESYQKLLSFKEAYRIAKKKKFLGSEEDFEKFLKTSEDFRKFAKRILTAYTG